MSNRLEVATRAVLAAGEEILRFDPITVEAEVKSTAGDLVTAADLASEKVITRIIKASFPHDLVISEETKEGQELLTKDHLDQLTGWVIDPIDGTNNFKKGMAYSGISIGYLENGQITIGVVYDPYRRELYIAEKDKGATKNGQPIQVSDKGVFDAGTRVCTSNSYEGGTQANLDRFMKLGHVWVDVLGSAVLIMTDVACGRLDLYHHNGLKPWDNAAAFLIAEEAGAKIVDLQGQSTTWLTSEVVMGNPALVDEFIARTTK
jgi:myo-inositol-1(or 4)-monophosphatase